MPLNIAKGRLAGKQVIISCGKVSKLTELTFFIDCSIFNTDNIYTTLKL